MKYSFLLAIIFSFSAIAVQAQKTQTSIKVWGNCGMCKKLIDKAALDAGAQKADWDTDTKQLSLVFNAKNTDVKKIQQAIANVGYDNEAFTAPDEVYNKLHACCKYERKEAKSSDADKCCTDGKCEKCKDGKSGEADCCKKEGTQEAADCCKKG